MFQQAPSPNLFLAEVKISSSALAWPGWSQGRFTISNKRFTGGVNPVQKFKETLAF